MAWLGAQGEDIVIRRQSRLRIMIWRKLFRSQPWACSLVTWLCLWGAGCVLDVLRVAIRFGMIGPAGRAAMLQCADDLSRKGVRVWRLRQVRASSPAHAGAFTAVTVRILQGTMAAVVVALIVNVFSDAGANAAASSPWLGQGCNCRTIHRLSMTEAGGVGARIGDVQRAGDLL
jgi:hypothetical protein